MVWGRLGPRGGGVAGLAEHAADRGGTGVRTWAVLALLQGVGILCVAQPWSEPWRDAGLALFAVEAVLLAAAFVPVFLFQWLHRGRSARESVRVTADVLMDQLVGLVP